MPQIKAYLMVQRSILDGMNFNNMGGLNEGVIDGVELVMAWTLTLWGLRNLLNLDELD